MTRIIKALWRWLKRPLVATAMSLFIAEMALYFSGRIGFETASIMWGVGVACLMLDILLRIREP